MRLYFGTRKYKWRGSSDSAGCISATATAPEEPTIDGQADVRTP